MTGPTGSGKSTTLYTTLTALNSPEKNIITVEDPVELPLKGINQVQLNLKAGLTFASALKSILRSDPDIVLVGEIRDQETAVISIEAALTGHMVLATLHTNSAAARRCVWSRWASSPSWSPRRSPPSWPSAWPDGCACTARSPTSPPKRTSWRPVGRRTRSTMQGEMPQVYRAVGCSACSNTGYRGRKALLELMLVTEEVERMIIEGGTADDIHRLAVEQGMVTLRQSGLRKALEGETTLEEVLRVVA